MIFFANRVFILENKCNTFMQNNLRAPPRSTVLKWGKTMKLPISLIDPVINQLTLRHQLGRIV